MGEQIVIEEGTAQPVELTALSNVLAAGVGALIFVATVLPLVLAVLITVWIRRIERHTASIDRSLVEMMRRGRQSGG